MEWKEVRLGDVIDYKKGFAFKSSMYKSTGTYIVRVSDTTANSVDVSLCNCISPELAHQYTDYSLKTKDIIIATVGSWPTNPASIVGKVVRVPKSANNALLNQNAVRIRSNGIIDSDYLYYLLKEEHFSKYLVGTAQGSANQASITLKDIFGYSFSAPSEIKDQRRIASILSSLDRKIELNNKINADLEEMAQAIFKNWFVDFEPFKDGEFVDSELGMIPQGWKVGCLGDIAEITSGKRPPKKSKDKTKDLSIPLIGASDIMGFTSDVLYDRPILVIGRVGTHGVVQRFQEKCWPSDNTLVIESSYYNYVYQLLKGIDYSAINRGSTQPLITQTDVKNTDIIIAPENVLKEYESITSTLFLKHRANIKESSRLSLLRDTLLPRLMSGEIEVPE